jgi:membrane-bound inhibitor of C-type lysozyme
MELNLSTISCALALALFMCVSVAPAANLVIHLPDYPSVSHRTVEYQCDPNGIAIGVRSGPFPVEYINAGTNSLVVVPIYGKGQIFSSVIAASGVRYTARQYTWWESKGSVVLSSDSATGKIESTCSRVNREWPSGPRSPVQ